MIYYLYPQECQFDAKWTAISQFVLKFFFFLIWNSGIGDIFINWKLFIYLYENEYLQQMIKQNFRQITKIKLRFESEKFNNLNISYIYITKRFD